MKTVSDLFAALERPRIVRETGLTHQLLHRAATENVMPAHWLFKLRPLCERDGIPVPDALFRQDRKVPAKDPAE